MAGERIRSLRRGLGLRAHAYRQGLQPLQQHPGIERRHRRAGLAHEVMDVLGDERFRGQDDSAEAAALAVDVFVAGKTTTAGPSDSGLCPIGVPNTLSTSS